MGKAVKLLDVWEEWRDAKPRMKELMVVSRVDMELSEESRSEKRLTVFLGSFWASLELGPFCWSFRDSRDQNRARTFPSGEEAVTFLEGWLRNRGYL